jgi:hypothetical protein
MMAELARANPAIYVSSATDSSFDDRELANVGEVDGMRATIQRNSQLVRNRITMDGYRQQHNLVRDLNKSQVDTNAAAWQGKSDKHTGLANYDAGEAAPEQEIRPLPNDARVVSVPLAQGRSDLLQFASHSIDGACMALGIPRAFLNGAAARTTGEAHAAAGMLEATVQRFKTTVAQVLEKLFTLVYPEQGAVLLVFPSLQPTQLYDQLFSQGVISYEAYIEFLSERHQIGKASFTNSDTARKHVVHPTLH